MSAQTATSPPTRPAPPLPRLDVTIGGVDRSLGMPFGLLNELTAMLGGPETVATVHFDPSVRTTVLQMVLATRDKRGKITNEEDDPIVPYDMDQETAEAIIDWVAAHCLDFFIRQFEKSAGLMISRAGDLAQIGSSLTSSPNSPGKTPSV